MLSLPLIFNISLFVTLLVVTDESRVGQLEESRNCDTSSASHKSPLVASRIELKIENNRKIIYNCHETDQGAFCCRSSLWSAALSPFVILQNEV